MPCSICRDPRHNKTTCYWRNISLPGRVLLPPGLEATCASQGSASVRSLPPRQNIPSSATDDIELGLRTLTINSDWSNRFPGASGGKLFPAIANIVQQANRPSFVTVHEIGPNNARNVIRACPDYLGVSRVVDGYSHTLLMWRKDRFSLLDVTSKGMNEGAFVQATLNDSVAGERVMVIGTHQPYKTSSNVSRAGLRKFIQEEARKDVIRKISCGGDFNTPAANLDVFMSECVLAFESDQEKTARTGCVDNILSPSFQGSFSSRSIMHDCQTFSHKPVVAHFNPKRNAFLG